MQLTLNGRAVAAIHLANPALPAEQYAADELQDHLRRISGATLAIHSGAPPATAARGEGIILVGRSPAGQHLPGFDWAHLQEDGCVVKTVDDRTLLLAGATPRGTLYAVYEFLDRALGCRWLTPACSILPTQKTILVDDMDIVHVPIFRYREPYFACAENADWAARNRVNGQSYPLTARHGGKWLYAGGGFAHTFYPLVPPEQYFDTHPEFYSELNGRRTHVDAQLCLTNDKLLDVICDNIRVWMRKDPDARILSVTQNDWNGWCRCARCRAIDDKEGSPSGTMVQFINRIAERMEPEFPKVLFDTFAYSYTVLPPRTVRPRKNVLIRLCNITPCCDAHPLEDCEQNRWFLDALKGWRAIAPQLFIWDYFNNFHHYFQPFPNIDAIAADIPLYAQSGVIGVFCQGDGAPSKGSGDMAELRAWLFSRLLWNPKLDAWKVTDEFVRLYYGPAAEYVREYLELLHQPGRTGKVHFHLYTPFESPVLAGDMIARCRALFDRAESAVSGDPILSDRVQTARLPLEYVTWHRDLRYAIRATRYQPAEERVARQIRSFFTIAAAHGAGALRETGVPMAQVRVMSEGYPLVRIASERLTAMVAPALGGRLLSLVNEGPGTEWIHAGHPEQVDYPFSGGYEEYSTHRWRSPGWNEDFRIEHQAPEELVLAARLAQGLSLRRVFHLGRGPAAGTLLIASSLTNTTAERRSICLRSMPEFLVGDLAHAQARWRMADDTWKTVAPWNTSTDAGGSSYLQNEDKPRGTCMLLRPGGTLQIEFEDEKIEKVLFDWDRRLQLIRFGIDSRGIVLDPGAAFTVTQKWIVQ